MKQLFSLTLVWVLTSTAGALQCNTCTDQACSTTIQKTCTTETMCITASITATSSSTTGSQIYMDCAPSSLCPGTGNQTFSVNIGVASAIASASCCNTDNCNSQLLPVPSSQSPNSLSCYICDPTNPQCTTPSIQCSGEETNCFSATGKCLKMQLS
nr:phospholipase A2 inhibitor and Ly6/PLAUR domain-containing protein-like [Nothobranchius furzeri]